MSKMEKYLYDSDKKELFLYSSLTTHQFNDTGAFIVEKYLSHVSPLQIADALVSEFHLTLADAQEDVRVFIEQLEELEIFPKENTFPLLKDSQKVFSEVAKRFQLHTPIIHIIQNCNSPCKMCDCWKTKGKKWHSANDLKPLFVKIKELGAVAVMVSGGEPLLHPEIEQIIEDLKEIGLKIMLNTNALLLRQHLNLSNYDVDQLVVSMDGYDAVTYQNFRGLNGYDVVWKNLELFQEKSPQTKIGIRAILNRQNYDKIDLLVDAVKSRGMHSVGLSPADVSSESFSREDINLPKIESLTELLIPTKRQIEDFLEKFTTSDSYYHKIRNAHESELLSWSTYDFVRCMKFYLTVRNGTPKPFTNEPCLFPQTSIVLDYNGDLRNCFYSPAFGNLYSLELSDWSFRDSMKKLEDSKKCESCRGKVFCGTQMAKQSSDQ
ncbi:MAG: radical SAM protein [Parachlamydia sp.]|nr:MAG: radical SAM protein [Parachlamydia sp.]